MATDFKFPSWAAFIFPFYLNMGLRDLLNTAELCNDRHVQEPLRSATLRRKYANSEFPLIVTPVSIWLASETPDGRALKAGTFAAPRPKVPFLCMPASPIGYDFRCVLC
jgi:hypothetical protein